MFSRTPAPERLPRLPILKERAPFRTRGERTVRGRSRAFLFGFFTSLLLPFPVMAQVFDGGGLGAGIGAAQGELAGTGVITANPNLVQVIGRVIRFILPLIGALALLALVIAGFYLILGFGTEESITRAKKIVIWSLIGIVVVLLSYPAVNFVVGLA